jgi:hypothetical protein
MSDCRLLLAALAASLSAGIVAAAPIASGAYDNTLLIGVDPANGSVSGYFDMTQGGQPSFSCIFYLKGRIAGGAAAVDTFFPDDPKGDLIRGSLTSPGPGKVSLTLPTEHGGCANVWHFADKSQPADFTLQSARPWISVRVAKAAKAYFYPAPGAARGKGYIVKGDGVGVRAAQAGWVQADFVGETRTSSGWLREQDLYGP